jgi:hypothetical protein
MHVQATSTCADPASERRQFPPPPPALSGGDVASAATRTPASDPRRHRERAATRYRLHETAFGRLSTGLKRQPVRRCGCGMFSGVNTKLAATPPAGEDGSAGAMRSKPGTPTWRSGRTFSRADGPVYAVAPTRLLILTRVMHLWERAIRRHVRPAKAVYHRLGGRAVLSHQSALLIHGVEISDVDLGVGGHRNLPTRGHDVATAVMTEGERSLGSFRLGSRPSCRCQPRFVDSKPDANPRHRLLEASHPSSEARAYRGRSGSWRSPRASARSLIPRSISHDVCQTASMLLPSGSRTNAA